jgi:hypothetical protein
MLNFTPWLTKSNNSDPLAKALQEFASANADKWPANSNSIEDYRKAITAVGSAPDRDDLLTTLGRLYERWSAGEKQTFVSTITDYLSLIALFVGGLIIAGGLAYGIFFNKSFFDLMSQSDHARGLITFLFSFATIGIIVLVAVAVLWMDKSEVEARFAHAKDLISILVGVLGTVIGFYFGTASTGNTATAGLRDHRYPTVFVHKITTPSASVRSEAFPEYMTADPPKRTGLRVEQQSVHPSDEQ